MPASPSSLSDSAAPAAALIEGLTLLWRSSSARQDRLVCTQGFFL